MTAINTNTAALNAQYYLAKSNKELESSMAKLSSGQKVNSAADDAAGLAIASRMTSQIKGLAMAVKNSNDSMSLAQTAEGAMEEVTNMLQRIRELAVQSANGTMNDSDRASLDSEVQALKTEIDRVANTTTFNSQKLLDGSYSSTFQIGDKGGQTVDLSINSVATSALGMSSGSSSSNSVVSARMNIDGTGSLNGSIDAGDVVVNGQALGAFATTDDVEAIVNNINSNVDNVTASAFNVVVAKNIGDGVTGGASGTSALILKTQEMGTTQPTTFVISASSSMTELVNNINSETGGVIKADVNSEGKLVLSNETGAFISVEDDSSSVGSGFSGHSTSAIQHNGFLKIESNDGSNIRIERGNTALASPGALADLQLLGLNETISTSAGDGYTLVGQALQSNTTHFTAREITRGDASNDEKQHIVNLTSTLVAGFTGGTVTLSDGANNTVTTGTLAANMTLAKLDSALDVAIAAFNSDADAASTARFAAAISNSGTNLVLDYTVTANSVDHGNTNHQAAAMSFTQGATVSGLESSIAKGDLTLNGVEIFNTDIASDTFGGKLNLINSFSADTGVVASATFDQTFTVDPNNIIKGDVIKLNGTLIDVTTSNNIDALITAMNARSDATGLTASKSGNNITFKGENVQALTIEQSTKEELTANLVSVVSAKGASANVDRTLTIEASDVHVGREYEVAIANSNDAGSPDVTVTVTAVSGDDEDSLATKIANAIRGADVAYRDAVDASGVSVGTGATANVITFNGASGSKLDAGLADITFKVNSIGDTFGTSTGAGITSYGSIKLDSTNNSPIKIDLGEVTSSTNHARLHGFLEANVGAADYDVNEPTLSAAGGTSMVGLSVTNQASATAALATIDRAIDSVNANRGTLGALQNRLEYTINNLSSISNATSGARGRILDADFAQETSQLTKNQILSQAATSMLAQANQSKQGILALLQG